ncbi:MAG: single-stranded DNA-binding protein [Anaerolineae bacterium]|nr:single-stranded DNA-binding protein [Anaerolineae bacterium]
MTFQQVTIVGNVGRDPEMNYTPQGIAVTKFTVAVNKVTGKGETRKEKTTWFRVSVWRDRAEVAAQYIKKGMKILVIGEVDVNAYTDKNGQPQATLELTANDFKFLDSRDGGGGGGGEYEGARSSNSGGGNKGGSYDDPNEIPF